MRRGWVRTAAVIVCCLICCSLWAQQVAARFDPQDTKIEFTLPATMHTVHGSFRLKTGAISFDSSTGKASGSLVVDAASGESGNQTRDHKMRNEVLEVQRYPEIVFTAQSVAGKLAESGPSHLEIRGTFRIHGADHPLTLIVDTKFQNGAADADIKFEVPYVDWGMKNPSTIFLKVSKKVDVSIHTHALLTQASAAKH